MQHNTFYSVTFCVAILILQVKSESLRCYVCNDCAEGYEDTAQTCVLPIPTLPPIETTTAEATTLPEDDTTTDTSTTDADTETTTTAPIDSDETVDETVDETYNVQMLDDDKNNIDEVPYAVVRQRREAGNVETSITRCVVTAHQANNKTVVVRGCSFLQNTDSNEAHCRQLIPSSYTGALGRCRVCEEDICNSAVKTMASISMLITVIAALL